MTDVDVEITEFEMIDPDELHLVGSGANGFKALLAKSASEEVREVLETIAEASDTEITTAKALDADDDRLRCDTCKGTGKVGNAKCKKCRGSGIMPKVGMSEKELLEAAKASDGAAPSGADVPVPENCPTCNGSGTMLPDGKECVDCHGTGKDGKNPTDASLKTMDAPTGKISIGDPQGREKIDKSEEVDLYDDDETDLEKAKLKTKARDALPDSAFALPATRQYPIHDENHARAALSMLHNASPADQKKIKAAVHRRYPNIGQSDDAQKADGSVFSAANPQLAAMATKVGGDDSSDDGSGGGDAPGSPAWEAVDADTATNAALALMTAAELIRTFGQREAVEVASGEGNDIFDTFASEEALCGVTRALGIMAQMAFHEGLEAAKSLDDDGVAEKAGKRLSTRSVSALAAARDHLNELLGKDDPATKDKSDDNGKSASEKFIASANKALLAKEIDNMTAEELIKLLDERDAQKAAEAEEAAKATNPTQDVDNTNAIAGGKSANSKAKTRKKKVASTDDVLEDEATQGTNDSASSPATGAAKSEEVIAELTPEEIEANEAATKARKAHKEAKKAQKKAAENAAIAKAITESVAKATASLAEVDVLKERLAVVENTVAPSDIVRTRPADAIAKSAERDAMELDLARCERMSKSASDLDTRREYNDRAKALRVRISALTA